MSTHDLDQRRLSLGSCPHQSGAAILVRRFVQNIYNKTTKKENYISGFFIIFLFISRVLASFYIVSPSLSLSNFFLSLYLSDTQAQINTTTISMETI